MVVVVDLCLGCCTFLRSPYSLMYVCVSLSVQPDCLRLRWPLVLRDMLGYKRATTTHTLQQGRKED